VDSAKVQLRDYNKADPLYGLMSYGVLYTRQVDHGTKCRTQLCLDCTIMLDQCNTLKIRKTVSFSYVGFCLVLPLIFLL